MWFLLIFWIVASIALPIIIVIFIIKAIWKKTSSKSSFNLTSLEIQNWLNQWMITWEQAKLIQGWSDYENNPVCKSLSSEIKIMVDKRIINLWQAEKIQALRKSEKDNRIRNYVFKTLFSIAGLMIWIGLIFIIASNRSLIPDSIKIVLDVLIRWGLIYAIYQSIVKEKHQIKELFLTISFLFVGASIGLISQIFHLNGGRWSFISVWFFLASPFALLSNIKFLHCVWIALWRTAFRKALWISTFEWLGEKNILIPIFMTWGLWLLTFIWNYLDKIFWKKSQLPRMLEKSAFVFMYLFITIVAWYWVYDRTFAIVFTFIFLGIMMLSNFYHKDMNLFRLNVLGIELYLFIVLFSVFDWLLSKGLGFLIGWISVLWIILLLKKTSSYIKSLSLYKSWNETTQ